MKKLLSGLLFMVSTAAYSAPDMVINFRPLDLCNLGLSVGTQIDTGTNLSVEINADLSFYQFLNELSSQQLLRKGTVGVRWYVDEDKRSGLFVTAAIDIKIRGLLDEDELAYDKDTAPIDLKLYASAGVGHKIEITDWLSVSNRIFVEASLYDFRIKGDAGDETTAKEAKAFISDMQMNAIETITGQAIVFKNILGEKVHYEIAKLEFSIDF